MGKVRGSWGGLGSDNIHGNTPALLPVLKVLLKINRGETPAPTSLKMAQKNHPQWLIGKEITLEGEKVLAKVKYLFPFLS